MGWPPDDEYPTVAQSGRPYEDARSPEVELVDAAVQLQKDLTEFRIRQCQKAGEFFPDHETVGIYVDVGTHIRGGPVGINIDKCLRLLCVQTDGTESQQLFSWCLILMGKLSM